MIALKCSKENIKFDRSRRRRGGVERGDGGGGDERGV